MKGNGEMDYFANSHAMFVDGKGNDMMKQAAQDAHNKAVEAQTKAFNNMYDKKIAESKEMEEKAKSLEIMPINQYVLVKPYAKNPFDKIEVTDSGIIIPGLDGSHKFKNPDTGEEDEEQNLSVQAEVIEVSPACKFVKEGDVVYYRRVSGVPIPFFRQGLEVVAEQQIQVVINEGLKTRFKNYE